jgi:hypothetical protein
VKGFRGRYMLTWLVLALSLSGALGQFGSKVTVGDADEGRLLHDFPAPMNPSLGYWDTGQNPGIYDKDDVVYLDFLGNLVIDANDLRLSDFYPNIAGTKVKSTDNDINNQLSTLPGPAAGIYYADLYGSQGYDLQDPVYVLSTSSTVVGAKTSTNDVRIGSYLGLSSGSKILNYYDNDAPVSPMIVPVSSGGPVASLRFYNSNGNVDETGSPIYDYEDDVYIDISLSGSAASGFPFGFVVPNDVRLFV